MKRLAATLLVGLSLLVACKKSSGSEPPSAIEGGGQPQPTAPPNGTPVFGGNGPEFMTKGTAHLEITGDATATLDLPIAAGESYWQLQGAGTGLTWATEQGSLTISGTSITTTGTRKTKGASLIVTITLIDPVILQVSDTGDCSITFTKVALGDVAGTLDCSFSARPLQATGSFTAQN